MVRQVGIDGGTGSPGIVTLIAAILLPPLGIFLDRGITPAFWLGVVLTIIGWLPGVLFAVLLLLIPERIPIR
ncbi:YqaE/Pmp3 family membrane protein [Sphingomonas montanisoli]|uniref:YqaE/Pmp3 family membrane protein n=1 Tax=Sphingomonas montanisoli TaxID=2606412 RepID=UPI001FE45730|nr:YqaE/Pmp3 family membrane protein [Sphingomonas montanisoli]